ncbi:MAG TPA: hypothetical protein VMX56_02350 [Anaerolineales bacterium]|nr:hypothetical protein [Anaerolineales bacterium]
MSRLVNEIMVDLSFIRSHTLQPKWFKILKIFILVAFFVVYYALFGIYKTVTYFAIFILLSLLVHMLYRVKTDKFRRSWLDFIVVEENGEQRADSIGKFYYSFIVLNTILSLAISQMLP